MRIFLFLLFFLPAGSLFSQTIVQLGNEIDTKILPDYPVEVYSDNAGIPFVVYIADDTLFAKKYTGGVWQNTAPGSLDTSVKDFDLHHIPETDETILVYTKSDGLFVKTYSNNTWSTTSEINEAIPGNRNNLMLTVDEENNLAYIVYPHWNGSDLILRFVTYNLNNNTFGTFSAPNSFANTSEAISGSDLQFNQQNGLLYLSSCSTPLSISSYNGSNWNDVLTTFDYQNIFKFKTGISSSKMIIAESAFVANGQQYYKLSALNTLDNVSTTLETIIDPEPFELTEITDIATSPANNYAAFAFIRYYWHTAPSLLKFYDGQNIYTVNHNLGNDKIRNCGFDAQERLLLATVYNETLKVYRMDSFTTGLADLDQTVDVSVYPNPASEYLVLSGQIMTNSKISISSISGQVLLSSVVEVENKAVISIKNLSEGVYFLHIQLPDGRKSIKQFIKKQF